MKSDELEARMRQLEQFHALSVLPGAWPVIRVDGRSFTRLAEQHFERPFDARFHDFMLKAAEALLVELDGVLVFTESDEISLLLPRESELFGREVEKLVSLSAAIASAIFSLALGSPVHFDSRIWVGPTTQHVIDYFRWRQADAERCCLNGWCYWTLRNEGKSVQEATAVLEGKGFSEKNELLFTRGINFNEVPLWQKHGVSLYWQDVEKIGFNPLTQQETRATRRRLAINEALPRGSAYGDLVENIIAGRSNVLTT
jgi:tRNA(His) guanylyltransferase